VECRLRAATHRLPVGERRVNWWRRRLRCQSACFGGAPRILGGACSGWPPRQWLLWLHHPGRNRKFYRSSAVLVIQVGRFSVKTMKRNAGPWSFPRSPINRAGLLRWWVAQSLNRTLPNPEFREDRRQMASLQYQLNRLTICHVRCRSLQHGHLLYRYSQFQVSLGQWEIDVLW
jgi:hypothetical protein